MNLSPMMKIITGAFLTVEKAMFGGQFERQDLEFIKSYCSALIKITDKTLEKKDRAKQLHATNGIMAFPVPPAPRKPCPINDYDKEADTAS